MKTNVKTCPCAGCAGLRQRYREDPALLQFCALRLLQRGWAGRTDDVEKLYMENHADWYQAAQERGRESAALNFENLQEGPRAAPQRRTEAAPKAPTEGKSTVARRPVRKGGKHDGV
jgi:hypothetical protein